MKSVSIIVMGKFSAMILARCDFPVPGRPLRIIKMVLFVSLGLDKVGKFLRISSRLYLRKVMMVLTVLSIKQYLAL